MHADAEPGSLLGKQKKSAADELSPEQPIAELIRGLLPLAADRHDDYEAACVADGVMTAGDLQSLDDEDKLYLYRSSLVAKPTKVCQSMEVHSN